MKTDELDIQIEMSRFYAQYHLIAAQTGVCVTRNCFVPTGTQCLLKTCPIGQCKLCWRPMSELELRKDALDTAERHMKRVEELLRLKQTYESEHHGLPNSKSGAPAPG